MHFASRTLFLATAVLLTGAASDMRVGHTYQEVGAVAQLGGALSGPKTPTPTVY